MSTVTKKRKPETKGKKKKEKKQKETNDFYNLYRNKNNTNNTNNITNTNTNTNTNHPKHPNNTNTNKKKKNKNKSNVSSNNSNDGKTNKQGNKSKKNKGQKEEKEENKVLSKVLNITAIYNWLTERVAEFAHLVMEYAEIPFPKKLISQFGSYGQENSQFSLPFGMTHDNEGKHIFIADTCNHRIQTFDFNGGFISSFGSMGSDPSNFQFPIFILNDNSQLLVSDRDNKRIQILNSMGDKSISQFPLVFTCGPMAKRGNELYVCDYLNKKLIVYDWESKIMLRTWGRKGKSSQVTFTGYPPEFAVAVDEEAVYVADTSEHVIRLFNHEGEVKAVWGKSKSNKDSLVEFVNPHCVYVTEDSVFVGDDKGVKILEKTLGHVKEEIEGSAVRALFCYGKRLYVLEPATACVKIYE